MTLGGGVGGLRLKNENRVIVRLESHTQGLRLNVGSASGIKVTMKRQVNETSDLFLASGIKVTMK
ncbi:MAG: hypothetical protein P9E24_08260 [Candidatus Competibacter sp.]|nr:hypothetical protein [Candidatus Competibacter sp.]MDG4584264.1 hypothetical protein [Candidatus Competibacter sp.]